MDKWRQYLLAREIVIRTDQKNIRELLQQTIFTPDQQAHVRKLLGFNFRIEYKVGSANKVADALSRREEDEKSGMTTNTIFLLMNSFPTTSFLQEL